MARPKVTKKVREISQKDRFTSFRNGFCVYCGSQDATLKEVSQGYHGHCVNPDCLADNFFTNKKAKDW